jgi:hypothetical protein
MTTSVDDTQEIENILKGEESLLTREQEVSVPFVFERYIYVKDIEEYLCVALMGDRSNE